MKIVKVKGGLGNQMFQYSFACLLRRITNEEVKIDMDTYKDLINDPIRRPRLLKYNISMDIADSEDISNLCIFKHHGNMLSKSYKLGILLESVFNKNYYFETDRGYRNINSILDYDYYDGYWQSWKHVDDIWSEIASSFVPTDSMHLSTNEMINRVSKENSVFIGVRRGDYQNRSKHYGSFGQDYYDKAINVIKQTVNNPVFYIFSNDIAWVKTNLSFNGCDVVYREDNDVIDDFEDLMIMAACKHSIIINSTYHWWGARLNEYDGKVIVAPEKWFFDSKPIDIVPDRWIRI